MEEAQGTEVLGKIVDWSGTDQVDCKQSPAMMVTSPAMGFA